MLTIGRLGAAAGVKVPTIRYYEEIGLLPAAERSAGNQRRYGGDALHRLVFIRHARELGFPLDAIRDLIGMADQPDRSCAAVDAIATRQLQAVRARIARLRALEAELQRMLGQCETGTVGACRVIEVLGDHSLCAGEHPAGDHLAADHLAADHLAADHLAADHLADALAGDHPATDHPAGP